MQRKVEMFKQGLLTKEKFLESVQGWNAYAKWANTFKLRREIIERLNSSPQLPAFSP